MEIDQAARCTDDDIGALIELCDLFLVGLASVDGNQTHRYVSGGYLQVFGDLLGKLTGGDHHEGARGAIELFDIGIIKDTIQKRHAKAVGFAHAGARLANQILTGQSDGQG